MDNNIPQIHLTNTAKLIGHTDVSFSASSFLINYHGNIVGCSHSLLFSNHFGVKPGIENREDIPKSVESWVLSPRQYRKSGLFKKLVVENPINVKGYLNIESDTELLLLDIENIAAHYVPIELTWQKPEVAADVMIITCPKGQKGATQIPLTGKIISAERGQLFKVKLNEYIRHASVVGSPILDNESRLIGMVTRFGYNKDGDQFFFGEKVNKIRAELKVIFKDKRKQPVAKENVPEANAEGQEITLSIDISGKVMASQTDIELRLKLENLIESEKVGQIINAGSGMGKMEVSFILIKDDDAMNTILEQLDLLGRTEIFKN